MKECLILCPYCKSRYSIRYGRRKTKDSIKQLYHCKICGKKFIEDKDYEKLKGGKKMTKIMCDLHNRGVSLRNIQGHLMEVYNTEVNHSNIYRRIKKFGGIEDEMPKMQERGNVVE